MKTVYIILFILPFTFCFSQNPLNASYKGLPDGEHIDNYSNGKIRTKWTIKNGNVVGQHLNYFKNGQLMAIDNFDNGKFNGTNYSFDKNGDTLILEKYNHDTITYFKEFIYYKPHQLKETNEAVFTDSLNSNLFPKAKDKIIYVEFNIMKLMATQYNLDTFKSYYPTGELKSICFGIKTKANGSYKEFYKNGSLKAVGEYKDHKLNGDYIEYNEKGEVIKKTTYRGGIKI